MPHSRFMSMTSTRRLAATRERSLPRLESGLSLMGLLVNASTAASVERRIAQGEELTFTVRAIMANDVPVAEVEIYLDREDGTAIHHRVPATVHQGMNGRYVIAAESLAIYGEVGEVLSVSVHPGDDIERMVRADVILNQSGRIAS